MDVIGTEHRRVLLVVKENVLVNPAEIRLLGPGTLVLETQECSSLLEQGRFAHATPRDGSGEQTPRDMVR